MVHDSMRILRLDRRLANRRSWISAEELESELQALPDVADKGEPVTDSEPVAEGAPEES